MKPFSKLIISGLAAFLLLSANSQAQTYSDSTFVDADMISFTPVFDRVGPELEQFLEQNSIRMEQKTKDFYEIKCTVSLTTGQFSELKKKLKEWKCQTLYLKETTRYVSKETAPKRTSIRKLENKIAEHKQILDTARNKDTRISLLRDIDNDYEDKQEYEAKIKELESKIGSVTLEVTLKREMTTPNSRRRIRYVNMPGFEYSILRPENHKDGITAESYSGYNLKYVFTQGKSHITIGVFKAMDVERDDTLTYSDIFNLSFGQDFYSRHLGRGSRKFLNLYSGYNIGFLSYNAESRNLRNFYVSPTVGIELFKNSFMLLDTKATYLLPFSHNYDLRGFQFAASLNFVF